MSSRVHSRRLLLAVFLISGLGLCDEPHVAAAFAKAASYVFSPDFIYMPVAQWFSEEELRILEEHESELNRMLQDAFAGSHSVGGAMLTAHFKIEENVAELRGRLFQPGTVYGWEGPDYDSEEDFLTDNQFVYHSVYLRAIEGTTGRPIYLAIQPTQREREELIRLLEDRSSEHYYWAKWLARKLMLLPSP